MSIDEKTVSVITSTACSFIPFTVVPDAWAGRKVVITLAPVEDLLTSTVRGRSAASILEGDPPSTA